MKPRLTVVHPLVLPAAHWIPFSILAAHLDLLPEGRREAFGHHWASKSAGGGTHSLKLVSNQISTTCDHGPFNVWEPVVASGGG